MKFFKPLLKKQIQKQKTVNDSFLKNNDSLPPIEDAHALPTCIEDMKEWHYKALRRLDKHAEKDAFSGCITLEVDIPKFIQFAQESGLIDWACYEECLYLLKNSDLKKILKNKKLKVSGKKQELVDRILNNISELQVRNLDEYSDFYILTEKGHQMIDDSYMRFEEEHINFFRKTIELIICGELDTAYRMICKRNAEFPVPPGININWHQRYYDGIPKEQIEIFSYQMLNATDKLITAASIYADMSGEGLDKVRFYLRHAFNVETNIVDSYECNSTISVEQNFNSYVNAEIEEYQFLATLDECTCPICGNLDGMIFKVSERKIGINYPPMHKGCRCTTIAVINGHVPKKRRARNPITHKSELIPCVTYSDWIKEFK